MMEDSLVNKGKESLLIPEQTQVFQVLTLLLFLESSSYLGLTGIRISLFLSSLLSSALILSAFSSEFCFSRLWMRRYLINVLIVQRFRV